MSTALKDSLSLPRRALLVVDMSVEQVENLHHRRATVIRAIQELASIEGHWCLKLDCRLWLHNSEESTLSLVEPEWGVEKGAPE